MDITRKQNPRGFRKFPSIFPLTKPLNGRTIVGGEASRALNAMKHLDAATKMALPSQVATKVGDFLGVEWYHWVPKWLMFRSKSQRA